MSGVPSLRDIIPLSGVAKQNLVDISVSLSNNIIANDNIPHASVEEMEKFTKLAREEGLAYFKLTDMYFVVGKISSSKQCGQADGVLDAVDHQRVNRYAVKLVTIRYEEQLRRIIQEGKFYDLLRGHPNIINCARMFYDINESTNRIVVCLVLEKSGPNVNELIVLRGTQFQERELRKVIRQLVSALKHGHKKRVAHRDLKQENILIETDKDGELIPKVIDYGFAKRFPENDSTGGSSNDFSSAAITPPKAIVMGTPHYSAPEVMDGIADETSCEAVCKRDVWALGLIVVEMIIGRRLTWAQKGTLVSNPHAVLATLPPKILDFLKLCLQPEVNCRASTSVLEQSEWLKEPD